MVRDALQFVNDFGVLCNASGKFKLLFAKIAMSDPDSVQHELFTCVLSMSPSVSKVKSNYFIVRPKVDQRAGLLSLPHLGIFAIRTR